MAVTRCPEDFVMSYCTWIPVRDAYSLPYIQLQAWNSDTRIAKKLTSSFIFKCSKQTDSVYNPSFLRN